MLLGATALLLTMLVPAIAAAGPGQRKVTICHVPPGNPDNAHTITVGEPAAKKHVEQHGDTYGPCPDKPDNGKKVVYYKKEVEKKDGHKKIECVKAPNKAKLPSDSYDKKYYSDSKCEKEKNVFVKTDKKAKKYKCVEKNKFWAIEHDKKMFKDGPSKKSKGCTEPYKKYHA